MYYIDKETKKELVKAIKYRVKLSMGKDPLSIAIGSVKDKIIETTVKIGFKLLKIENEGLEKAIIKVSKIAEKLLRGETPKDLIIGLGIDMVIEEGVELYFKQINELESSDLGRRYELYVESILINDYRLKSDYAGKFHFDNDYPIYCRLGLISPNIHKCIKCPWRFICNNNPDPPIDPVGAIAMINSLLPKEVRYYKLIHCTGQNLSLLTITI